MLRDTATRTLLAVIAQDRPTVRSVASAIGKSPSATHAQLRKLRDAGLLKWDAEKRGTLRAMVAPTAHLFGYDRGTQPSGPGAASTARDLADHRWRVIDMDHRTAAVNPERDGR